MSEESSTAPSVTCGVMTNTIDPNIDKAMEGVKDDAFMKPSPTLHPYPNAYINTEPGFFNAKADSIDTEKDLQPPCPNCGYCPHCGRGGIPPKPTVYRVFVSRGYGYSIVYC